MLDLLDFVSKGSSLFKFGVSFLFVFALVFGLLQIARRKKKEGNIEERLFPERVNVILALAIALISVAYAPLNTFIWSFIPIATIIFIFLFFIVMIKNILKGEKRETMPLVVSIGLLILVLGVIGEFLPTYNFISLPFSSRDILWILGIILVLLLFYFAYLSGGESQPKKQGG